MEKGALRPPNHSSATDYVGRRIRLPVKNKVLKRPLAMDNQSRAGFSLPFVWALATR